MQKQSPQRVVLNLPPVGRPAARAEGIATKAKDKRKHQTNKKNTRKYTHRKRGSRWTGEWGIQRRHTQAEATRTATKRRKHTRWGKKKAETEQKAVNRGVQQKHKTDQFAKGLKKKLSDSHDIPLGPDLPPATTGAAIPTRAIKDRKHKKAESVKTGGATRPIATTGKKGERDNNKNEQKNQKGKHDGEASLGNYTPNNKEQQHSS